MSDLSSLYIDRPGDFLPRHPYLHERVQLRSFLLDADPQRLQALCDRSLNAAAGGGINFRPLSSTVWLTFATIPRVTSADPRDRDTGWMSEIDVAFWVPLVSTCEGVARTCWYMPFVFVDSPFGMVGGREIYGFVKTLARFEIPEALDSGAPYAVEAMSLAQRGADSRVQMHRLLELTQKPRVPGRAPAAPLRSVRNMIEMMPLLPGQGWRERLGVARSQIASSLVRREVPIVFLRQLRDLEHPERAAFRELAEAPAKVTRFYRGGFLPDEFELKLAASASHPMAETLGLRGAGHPVKAAFWAEFDFLMDKGVRLAGPRRATDSSRGVAPIASPACLPAPPETTSRATAGSDAPRKIAVLGGGIGSLSTVLALTNEPNWRERYDITVYQMGGRLGGKGASSRNLDMADRIEEHGLHIWFGFYDQAFRMMRQCYEERNLPKGTPLATFEDAFKPQRSVVLTEQVDGEWQPWVLDFPPNGRVPGDGRAPESIAEWTRDMFSWTRTGIESFWGLLFPAHAVENRATSRLRSRLRTARSSLLALFRVVDRALRHAAGAGHSVPTVDGWRAANALRQVRDVLRATAGSQIESDTRVRRVWLCVDFSLSNLIGMLVDRGPQRGFEHLDEIDYAAWLSRHGAMPMTVTSPLVRAIYDLAFAYRDGDVSKPDFGAGTALQGVLRMLLTYKGAFMWKMQAGMGEVVITPLYEVLRARGVKFEFFHRVRSLGLSRDGEQLETIHVGRQATVKEGAYRPLVDIGGVACWPHRPLYEQLVEGEALAAAGVDLESTWAPWPDVETRVLRLGTDFDEVVLGISLGALPAIASEIIERKPKFRAMVENVKTTPTLAFQVWTKPTLDELGSTHVSRWGERTVQGAFVEPIDTWADMSHLLDLEHWPAPHRPRNLAYYCGPLDQRGPASAVTGALAESELQRVKAMARAFLDRDALVMFPRAAAPGGGFNWELLIDVAGRRGPDRLEGQYYRANIDGSDHYVLSVAGSNRYRLKTDGSGVSNLFLTGDWIDCGLNAGCIEATVMAGNQCARAVADKAKATRLLASVA